MASQSASTIAAPAGPPRASQRLEASLRALLLRHRPELFFKGGLRIVFHQNSSTMISLSRGERRDTLRLHRLFFSAPEEVLEAIVRAFFTRLPPEETRALRARILDFVERNRQATIAAAQLPATSPPQGRIYDLLEVQEEVTARYVPEHRQVSRRPAVAWSRRATPSLMGKWIETPPRHPNLIVINRLLDDESVPRFYLDYILYHELLHDLFPIRRVGGRWIHHSAEFRRRERRFAGYEEARRWEEQYLPRLLRQLKPAGRSGR